MEATRIHCCRHRCTSAANLHFNELPLLLLLLLRCDAFARPQLGLVSRQGLTSTRLCVSMSVSMRVSFVLTTPLKNDLRAFLKRPNLSNNTLTWRRHWPRSNSLGLIQHPHRLVHVFRCHLCPSPVSFPTSRAAINGTFAPLICTNEAFFHIGSSNVCLQWMRSMSGSICGAAAEGWSLSFSLSRSLSSGIFTHFAECGTCNGTLLHFNATEAALPRAAAGRRLFLALERQKVSMFHLLPPASC